MKISPAAAPLDFDAEALRSFISVALHDLREPIRAIRAGTEILAAQCGELDEKATRNLRFVNDGADRIEILVRNLGEFSAEELRQIELTPVALDRVVQDAKAQSSQELKGAGATITSDPLPKVEGDGEALAIVFRNLFQNACKFRADAAPAIHVSAAESGPEWIVSVRDNGMGFKPEYRELVFKPFERLNGKKYPGSGLGLTLARRIVQRHGGHMWAESTPGEGSVFSFSVAGAE
jgi:light-regulated signal transduction histidine kinase (bacteriophytochrome)